MKEQPTTGTLTDSLKGAFSRDLKAYLDRYEDALIAEEKPFSAYIRKLLKDKHLQQRDVLLRADIPENYGYKLISGEKHTVQRDTVIRLCLAAEMDLQEADKALKLYGFAPLYPRLARDAALIIAFNTGIHLPEKADELLSSHDLEPLRRCRTD